MDFQSKKYNLLVICKGNIIRSPLASEIIRKESIKMTLNNRLEIRSVATENYNIGTGAHPNTIKVGLENGYDISKHLAKQVDIDDIDWADLIIVMDNENKERLVELFGSRAENKIRLLLSYSDNKLTDVLDPYEKNYEYYQQTFNIIKKGCIDFLNIFLENK